tara:strand:+ start:8482 stop:9429 length:948 start_codon:yes stop_codon:yes gene_type:complete
MKLFIFELTPFATCLSPALSSIPTVRWCYTFARGDSTERTSYAMSLAARSLKVQVAPLRPRVTVPRRSVAPLRAAASASAYGKKIAVLGGTGFVGTRVVKLLQTAGADVVSVSKSGTGGVAIDLTDAGCGEALKAALQGCDAVVSCVGVIGGDDDKNRLGNGDANVVAVAAAEAAGVKRFVYVSVASIVPDVVGGAGVLKGYFEGKEIAESAVTKSFGEKNASLIVKPSFIYGGDAFGINPPRVTKQYGDILVKLLGAGFVKSIAEKMPGPIKLTLAEPVSVDDVASACAAGALGKNSGQCDGTDEIKQCAQKMH